MTEAEYLTLAAAAKEQTRKAIACGKFQPLESSAWTTSASLKTESIE